jgi:3',5'-cyclic AMP phosphodiesterase CpdA
MSLRTAIRLAHLSDTHLAGESGALPFGQDATANLAAVVDAFSTRPDVAVITGDLAEDARSTRTAACKHSPSVWPTSSTWFPGITTTVPTWIKCSAQAMTSA